MSLDTGAQITDLTVNDHACLTFGESEELADLTAAFVRDGLAAGSRVVWLSDTPQAAAVELGRRGLGTATAPADPSAERTAAAGAGPIAVVDCQEGLMAGRAFEVERAVGWLREQVAAAQRKGYRGLRVALDMAWALRPVDGIEQLPVFEREIAAMVGELATRTACGPGSTAEATGALSVLCQYDRERFDPVTLASVAPFHAHSVAAATYHDDELLRICRQYAPPGIRIAGQIDVQAQEALALALSEAIRVDGDITVNMAELTFIDVSTTRMILDAARSIAHPRRVILKCHPAIESRFVILGVADLPNVDVSRR
ncbi:MEDS domain-containing protein [Actinoallomurus sp. CA-150999]|uniref:MEDS domain-containing protein n=1 Tax=Actinoallomurus sp. CA-150999 TaxID=3239887 RepID=UPI003D8F71EE